MSGNLPSIWDYVPREVAESQFAIKGFYDRREYHNWDHITHMWTNFVMCGWEHAELRGPMALAILMHDIYYDPKADFLVNETQSMLIARYNLERSSLVALPAYGWVLPTILKTAFHPYKRVAKTLPFEEGLLLDLDLLGFAGTTESVIANGEKIRQEYSHVPELAFYVGRERFLSMMLDVAMQGLYYTFGREQNQLAEHNIAYELDLVSKRVTRLRDA